MDAAYTGKEISERRKALGLTQKELAEKLHVTDKAVSKWERGINFPDLGLMENLAKVLDTGMLWSVPSPRFPTNSWKPQKRISGTSAGPVW